MQDGRLKKLYDSISAKFDIGTYDDWSNAMLDEGRRKKFYDNVSRAYDIGDYEKFNGVVGDEIVKPYQAKQKAGKASDVQTAPAEQMQTVQTAPAEQAKAEQRAEQAPKEQAPVEQAPAEQSAEQTMQTAPTEQKQEAVPAVKGGVQFDMQAKENEYKTPQQLTDEANEKAGLTPFGKYATKEQQDADRAQRKSVLRQLGGKPVQDYTFEERAALDKAEQQEAPERAADVTPFYQQWIKPELRAREAEEQAKGEAAARAFRDNNSAVGTFSTGAMTAQASGAAFAKETAMAKPEDIMNDMIMKLNPESKSPQSAAFNELVLKRMGMQNGKDDKDSKEAEGVPQLSAKEAETFNRYYGYEYGKIAEEIQKQMYDEYKQMGAPKSTLEWLMGGLVKDNIASIISQSMIEKAARSSAVRTQMRDMAYEDYGKNAGLGANVAKGLGTLVADPAFYVGMGAGSAVAKGATDLIGKTVAKKMITNAGKTATKELVDAASRYAVTNIPGIAVASGAISSGMTLGTTSAIHTGVNQFKAGEYDGLDILKSFGEDALVGGVTGGISSKLALMARGGSRAAQIGAALGSYGTNVTGFSAFQLWQKAAAEGKDISDITIDEAAEVFAENAATFAIMDLPKFAKSMRARTADARKEGMELTPEMRAELKDAGYENLFGELMELAEAKRDVANNVRENANTLEDAADAERADQMGNAEVLKRLDDLVRDKKISSETRRRVYWYATGQLLKPEGVFAVSPLRSADDGKTYRLNTIGADGQMIESKSFGSINEARKWQEQFDIERQANMSNLLETTLQSPAVYLRRAMSEVARENNMTEEQMENSLSISDAFDEAREAELEDVDKAIYEHAIRIKREVESRVKVLAEIDGKDAIDQAVRDTKQATGVDVNNIDRNKKSGGLFDKKGMTAQDVSAVDEYISRLQTSLDEISQKNVFEADMNESHSKGYEMKNPADIKAIYGRILGAEQKLLGFDGGKEIMAAIESDVAEGKDAKEILETINEKTAANGDKALMEAARQFSAALNGLKGMEDRIRAMVEAQMEIERDRISPFVVQAPEDGGENYLTPGQIVRAQYNGQQVYVTRITANDAIIMTDDGQKTVVNKNEITDVQPVDNGEILRMKGIEVRNAIVSDVDFYAKHDERTQKDFVPSVVEMAEDGTNAITKMGTTFYGEGGKLYVVTQVGGDMSDGTSQENNYDPSQNQLISVAELAVSPNGGYAIAEGTSRVISFEDAYNEQDAYFERQKDKAEAEKKAETEAKPVGETTGTDAADNTKTEDLGTENGENLTLTPEIITPKENKDKEDYIETEGKSVEEITNEAYGREKERLASMELTPEMLNTFININQPLVDRFSKIDDEKTAAIYQGNIKAIQERIAELSQANVEPKTAPENNAVGDGQVVLSEKEESANYINNVADNYIGKTLDKEKTAIFIDCLKDVAETVPEEVEFTEENYNRLFGNGVETPLGKVKMSDGQMNKMSDKGRTRQMGLAKRTLEAPDFIIEKPSKAKEGQLSERDYSYLFVKTFVNEDGTETTYYYSVTIQKDGTEISVSNYPPNEKQVKRELRESKLTYIRKVTLPSDASTSTQGDQLTKPAGTISDGKDSSSATDAQIIGDNNAGSVQTKAEKKVNKNSLQSRINKLQPDEMQRWQDYVLASVAGGVKFSTKDTAAGSKSIVKHVTGRKADIPLFMLDNTNGGVPEVIAHQIWENMPERMREQCDAGDVFEEIVDIIGSYQNYSSMVDALEKNLKEQDVDEDYNDELKDKYAQDRGFADYEDMQAHEVTRRKAREQLEKNISKMNAEQLQVQLNDWKQRVARAERTYKKNPTPTNFKNWDLDYLRYKAVETAMDKIATYDNDVEGFFDGKQNAPVAEIAHYDFSIDPASGKEIYTKTDINGKVMPATSREFMKARKQNPEMATSKEEVKRLRDEYAAAQLKKAYPSVTSVDEADNAIDALQQQIAVDDIADEQKAQLQAQVADLKRLKRILKGDGSADFMVEDENSTTVQEEDAFWDGMLKKDGKEPGTEQTELNRAIGEQFVTQLNNVLAPIGGEVKYPTEAEAQKELEAAYQKANKESVDAISDRFDEELLKQKRNELPSGHVYELGMPSSILTSTGIPDLPIQMNPKRLMDKATKFGHDFDIEDVKGLVNSLQNPLAIFAYGDAEKAQNIVVEIQKDGKNFIVGLSLNPIVGGKHLEINSIRNVFPKDNAEWLNWVSQGKLLYCDKQKIKALIDKQQTNLADVEYLDLNSIANIIDSFENPAVVDNKNTTNADNQPSNSQNEVALTTKSGNIYGYAKGKDIYLLPKGVNPNTPVHEYEHLWAHAMQQNNPEGWASIVQIMKETPLWEEVMNDEAYSNIHGNEDKVAEECLSRGGARYNHKNVKKILDEVADDPVELAKQKNFIEKIWDALNKFWKWTSENIFKIKKFESFEQVMQQSLGDFYNGRNLKTGEIGGKAEAKNASEEVEEPADFMIELTDAGNREVWEHGKSNIPGKVILVKDGMRGAVTYGPDARKAYEILGMDAERGTLHLNGAEMMKVQKALGDDVRVLTYEDAEGRDYLDEKLKGAAITDDYTTKNAKKAINSNPEYNRLRAEVQAAFDTYNASGSVDDMRALIESAEDYAEALQAVVDRDVDRRVTDGAAKIFAQEVAKVESYIDNILDGGVEAPKFGFEEKATKGSKIPVPEAEKDEVVPEDDDFTGDTLELGNMLIPLRKSEVGHITEQVYYIPMTNGNGWDGMEPKVAVMTSNLRARYPQLHSAAKKGDVLAARTLIEETFGIKRDGKFMKSMSAASPAQMKLRKLQKDHPDAIVVYPHRDGNVGSNVLGQAYAQFLEDMGFELDDNIIMINRPHHTDATKESRLLRRARFEGAVKEGREYIIIDDHITMGGTIRDMKDFVEAGGGKVVAASTLTKSMGDAATLVPTVEQINNLIELGVTDEQLRKIGISNSISNLTKGEAERVQILSQSGRNRRGTKANARGKAEGEGVSAQSGRKSGMGSKPKSRNARRNTAPSQETSEPPVDIWDDNSQVTERTEVPEQTTAVPQSAPAVEAIPDATDILGYAKATTEKKAPKKASRKVAKTTKYKAKDGETVQYKQLNLFDKTELDNLGKAEAAGVPFVTPEGYRMTPLEPGSECYVERRYSENGHFSFIGGEKIESPDDVAFLFKKLEDKAIENTFLVLVDKDGKPTILHTGIGDLVGSVVDLDAITVAAKNINPVAIYAVHNHPSGSLNPSTPDRNFLARAVMRFGDVVKEGIIIDTLSGKYSQYSAKGSEQRDIPTDVNNPVSYKVYSFDKLVFGKDFNPNIRILTHEDVAAFVSSHRLGSHAKTCMLGIDNAAAVTGNYALPVNIGTDTAESIAKAIEDILVATNTRNCIIYGNNFDLTKFKEIKMRLTEKGLKLLDACNINGKFDIESAVANNVLEPDGTDMMAYAKRNAGRTKNHEVTYKAENGQTIRYKQLDLFDSAPAEDETPVAYRMKPLKPGEKCYVERRYTENGMFKFDGSEKIESSDDVAYLFRTMQHNATRNVFYVLVDKDGKPTIIHGGMGSKLETVYDISAPSLAIDIIQPKSIFMVTNQPKGSLEATKADFEAHKKLKDRYGDIVEPGIMLDSISGKYGMFGSGFDLGEFKVPSEGGNEAFKVYSFDKQVFAKDFLPFDKIRGGMDVSSFLSAHRYGKMHKTGVLILNNNGNVTGDYVLNLEVYKSGRELANAILDLANFSEGKGFVVYGEGIEVDNWHGVSSITKANGLRMIDAVNLIPKQGDNSVHSYYDYVSGAETGQVREDEPVYDADRIAREENMLNETFGPDGDDPEPQAPEPEEGELLTDESYRLKHDEYVRQHRAWVERNREASRGVDEVLYSGDTTNAPETGVEALDADALEERDKFDEIMNGAKIDVTKRAIKKMIKEEIRERRRLIESSNFEDAVLAHDIKKVTTPYERMRIPFILEGTDKEPVSDELKAVVEKIRNWFDEVHQFMSEEGLFMKDDKKHYIDNYVTHIWDFENSNPDKVAEYKNWVRMNSPYTRERVIPSLAEGLEMGLKMKYEDITDIMMNYGHYATEAVANRRLVNFLKGFSVDGFRIMQPDTVKDADYVRIDNNALDGLKVYKGVEPLLSVVFGKLHTSDNERLQKVAHVYDVVGGVMKKINLSLSFFHHGALTETAISMMNPYQFGKALFKNMIWDAAMQKELPAFLDVEATKDAVNHFVTLGATQDYLTKDVQGITANIRKFLEDKNVKGLKEAAALADMFNVGMDTVLWDWMHDGYKIYSFKKIADEIRRKAEKNGWSNIKLNMALDEAGQLVNDTFGGQHWDLLMKSPSTIKWARRFLLSPDWTISTIRQFLSMFGIGAIYDDRTFWEKIIRRNTPNADADDVLSVRRKYGRAFWLMATLIFGTFYNALNAMFRKKDENDELAKAEEIRKVNPNYKSPYELAYPDGMKWWEYTMLGNTMGQQTHLFAGRYDNGEEMYLRWGKQFREAPELFFGRDGFSIPGPMIDKMAGKLNPLLNTTANVISGYSLTGWANPFMKNRRGWEKEWGRVQTLVTAFTPYSIPTDADKEFVVSDLLMPSTKGFTPYKAKRGFETAITSGDLDLVGKVYNACVLNGLNADELYETTLKSIEATARKSMIEGIENVGDACVMFDNESDPKKRAQLSRYIKKMLSAQDWNQIEKGELVQKANDVINGESVDPKSIKEYDKLMNSNDVIEDWRLSKAITGLKPFYDEYRNLAEAGSPEAKSYLEAHRASIIMYKKLSGYRNGMNTIKRTLGKPEVKNADGSVVNDQMRLNGIRSLRREALSEE